MLLLWSMRGRKAGVSDMGESGWFALAGMAITSLVAFVRLEGRVNGHDREHLEHSKRHTEMREDLSYIRERIDRALNGKH